MDEFLTLFGDVKLGTIILIFTAVGFLYGIFKKGYKNLIDSHDALQEKEQAIVDIKDAVQTIQQKQFDMEETVKEIKEKQYVLMEKQETFEASVKARELNALREKLLQSYRYYTNPSKNPQQAWDEMEKESFEKLFKDYEDLGGNGFMHNPVYVEMMKLDVIPMSDPAKVNALKVSRKG